MTDGDEIVYLGCYTAEAGTRGRHRRGAPGPGHRRARPLGTVAPTVSPSFLARHPTLPVLYAVNELAEGTVSAWAIDGATPALRPARQLVRPAATARVTWRSRRTAGTCSAANYGSGSVSVHPLDPAGVPGERTDLRGARRTRSRPATGRSGAHAHMVSPDPAGGSLLAVDLGTDAVYRYDVDAAGGRLLPPRAGDPDPTRHRTAAPRPPPGRPPGYLAGELDATVTAYDAGR